MFYYHSTLTGDSQWDYPDVYLHRETLQQDTTSLSTSSFDPSIALYARAFNQRATTGIRKR